jgi:hypothetical protein
MKISIAQALTELGVTEWVLRGEPTNEAEFSTMFSKVTGADANGTAIEEKDPNVHGVVWADVVAKRDELIAAQPLKELRAERDRRIAETDWWASSDLTMTPEQTAYRQALRDITETYSSLEDVVWPVKP